MPLNANSEYEDARPPINTRHAVIKMRADSGIVPMRDTRDQNFSAAQTQAGHHKLKSQFVTSRPIARFALAGCTVAAQFAWSAPPLATDDASTLSPGMCQFEIEQRQFRYRIERDIVPTCNFLFDAEIGVGHLHVAPKDGPRADSVVYQFKRVFAPADPNGWAIGINGATVRSVKPREQAGTQQHYLNVLLSRPFGATLLHANMGGVADRQAVPGTRRNRLTWALAAEHEASPRWTLLGEVFGQRGQPETAQIGLRWWAMPKYIQFTSSLGSLRGAGRDGRWVSVGIRFETGDSIF